VENTKVKKKVYIGLGSLQAFIGLGALGGGFMLVKDPSGSALGLPMSFLEGSHFSFGCEWAWKYDWCWSYLCQKTIR